MPTGDVYSSELRWPPPSGEWFIRLRWADIGDRRECIGFEAWRGAAPRRGDAARWNSLRGASGPKPITATAVRKDLPLATIIEQERARGISGGEASARYWAEAGEDGAPMRGVVEYGKEQAAALSGTTHRVRPGRPTVWTDDQLRGVAAVYTEAWKRGANPTKSVEQHFDVTYAVAAKLVTKARRSGFLGETTQGRGGAVKPTRARRNRR